MTPRARILTFGSAVGLVAAGVVSFAVFEGLTGEVLAIALVSVGLGGAVLLLFLEVGLSEDRARALEERRARERSVRKDPHPRFPLRRGPRPPRRHP